MAKSAPLCSVVDASSARIQHTVKMQKLQAQVASIKGIMESLGRLSFDPPFHTEEILDTIRQLNTQSSSSDAGSSAGEADLF